jgi:hypothetical protein
VKNGHPGDDGNFERRLHARLDESARNASGHVRSRLTRARYAAVEEAERTRKSFWRQFLTSSRGFLPAGTVAAAVLVAMLLLSDRLGRTTAPGEEQPSTFEEIELLADAEVLELLQEADGEFYEWAAEQSEIEGSSG